MENMLIFASPAANASGEGVFASRSAKSAVEAAAGVSIAGARAMALVGAEEVATAAGAIRALALAGVCGGALVGIVGDGETAPLPTAEDDGTRLSLLAELSERLDMPLGVSLPENFRLDAPVPGREAQRYRKQPEKFVLLPDNAAALAHSAADRAEKTAAALAEAGFAFKMPSYAAEVSADAPMREMCVGCPYRGAFYVVSKLWLRAASDAGCTRLGARPPLLALDAAMNAGSATAVLRGMLLALGDRERSSSVGIIDVAGLRRGGTDGLAELAADKKTAAVIVLDNSPGGTDIENALACAKTVAEPDPSDAAALEDAVRAALSGEGLGVVVCRRPCARLTEPTGAKYEINADRCRGCGACSRLGCPAIEPGRRPSIDADKCVGCGLCAGVCKCDAVRRR